MTEPATPDFEQQIRAVQHIIRERARAADQAVNRSIDRADHIGKTASLRGKRVAYREAADLIEAALRGGGLRTKFRPLTPIGRAVLDD